MSYCEILENSTLHGDYHRIVFHAPEASRDARAGQFVHVRIDERTDHMLRRPFSVCDTDSNAGTLTVLYKKVGFGTEVLASKKPGELCDIIGPVGRGFTEPQEGIVPVVVAGGYGDAATFMLTKGRKGVLLFGSRGEADIIWVDEYKKAGWDVRISTDDGSVGTKGRVTTMIEPLLKDRPGEKLFFYGCGPQPMLRALAVELRRLRLDGELSADQMMCCGVGACFGCVVKTNAPGGWTYKRSCVDGPVFSLSDFYVEE